MYSEEKRRNLSCPLTLTNYSDNAVYVCGRCGLMITVVDTVQCWPEGPVFDSRVRLAYVWCPIYGGSPHHTLTRRVFVGSGPSNHRNKKMVPVRAVNDHVRMLVPCANKAAIEN